MKIKKYASRRDHCFFSRFKSQSLPQTDMSKKILFPAEKGCAGLIFKYHGEGTQKIVFKDLKTAARCFFCNPPPCIRFIKYMNHVSSQETNEHFTMYCRRTARVLVILACCSCWCSQEHLRVTQNIQNLLLPDMKDLPKHYHKPLKLIFGQQKYIEEGRPIRIQLLDDFYNTNFHAIIAAMSLQKNPLGRCAIIVSNKEVAMTTLAKLQEYNLDAQFCSAKAPADPTRSIAVCTLYGASAALHGQYFDTKIMGVNPTYSRKKSVERIAGRRQVQVVPDFLPQKIEIDYRYPMEQAYRDGKVAALQALVVPLLFRRPLCTEKLARDVAELLRLKIADWAPMTVFFNQARCAEACVAALQRLHISAGYWPTSANIEASKRERSRLETELSEGQLQVLCSTKKTDATLPPKGVRSIVRVVLHIDGARTVPAGLHKALRMRRDSGSCRYICLCCGPDGVKAQTRLAATSLPFFQATGSDTPTLNEISEIFTHTLGVSFHLMKPNGEIAEATEKNLAKIILEQRAGR